MTTPNHVGAPTARCQARLRIDDGSDACRCPKPAKGAYVIDLDRGVRLLCGMHGTMANRCAVGPMDVESADLPTALVTSLLEAHAELASVTQARISQLTHTWNASLGMLDKCRAVLQRRYQQETS